MQFGVSIHRNLERDTHTRSDTACVFYSWVVRVPLCYADANSCTYSFTHTRNTRTSSNSVAAVQKTVFDSEKARESVFRSAPSVTFGLHISFLHDVAANDSIAVIPYPQCTEIRYEANLTNHLPQDL